MFRFSVTVFLSVLVLPALAQLTPPPHMIRLHSGDTLLGSRLLYYSPILQSSYFELDGKRFETPEIAFFQNNHGLFANLNKLHGDKAERYAIRIRPGKINLFEEIDIVTYGGDAILAPEGTDEMTPDNNEMLATGEEFQYYTKGSGPIKEASYKNLKVDLADNDKAMAELRVFRNVRYFQFGLIAAGAGIISYELARQASRSNESADAKITFTPMIALGIVVGGSSYFLERPKNDARWFAMEEYNR